MQSVVRHELATYAPFVSAGSRDPEVTYDLGVDLGTTYSSIALIRGLRAEMIVLGHRSPLVPSAVWLGSDGEVLVGDAALRRGQREPEGLVREFKRRLGDPVPIVVRGMPVSANQLTTMLMASIMDEVVSREGKRPARVAVTHPANWGPYRIDIFREAVRSAGVNDAILVSEPEAAALYYASAGRIADGEIVVVYDLGGGTFDVAILQRQGDQFAILGRPDGVERLGGIDFDEAVFDYVRRAIGGLDGSDDDAWNAAVRRLHDDCVDAKEALSADVVVDISVMLPARHIEIRLPRREFEDLIRSSLTLTIDAVRRALASAHLEPEDIARVLLVGGSSRIPLVAELISSKLRRGVSVDVHPKFAVVLGAAMSAASGGAIDERVTIGAADLEPVTTAAGRLPVVEATDVHDQHDEPLTDRTAPPIVDVKRSNRRQVLVGAGAGLMALLALGGVLLATNGSDDASSSTTGGNATVVVELGSPPAGLALGFGSAWAVTGDGQLIEVDEASRVPGRRTALAPALDDVVVGASDVWATGTDAIYRIEPTSAAVSTIPMPGAPEGISHGQGAVWIALNAAKTGALYRVDESTGSPTLLASFPLEVTEVAVAEKFIWVSSAGRFLYRFDPSSSGFTEVDIGGTAGGIVIGFGGLWATLPATNELVRLDASSGQPLVRITTGAAPNEIIVGDGVLWVSEEGGGSVIAVDPGSNAIKDRVSVGAKPDRMAWRAPNLWVANSGEASLSIVPR
jgi:molecular chaperone DnaK